MGRKSIAEKWTKSAKEQARRIHKEYWSSDGGYFREKPGTPRLSSEANLAAIAWGFADEAKSGKILHAMDRIGLLTPWGPRAGQRYPRRSKTVLACLAGIQGYHDDFIWLWNTALLMQALRRLNRQSLLDELCLSVCDLLKRDGVVSEVYHPHNGEEVKTWLFKSERPFSWSAAMILEALETAASNSRKSEKAGKSP
jgi:glycogen debranching enzyme